MKSPIHHLILLLVTLMTAGAVIAADDSTPSPTSSPSLSPAPASTPSASLLAENASAVPLSTSHNQKIVVPVEVGDPVKGIKIPQYDEKGNLTMCLTAETALKLNERQVELGKLKVQFDEKAEKEIVVEIPHSILNLDTKILSADSETLIHREDFDIVGESAEFDTLARQGIFNGHVHASFINEAPISPP